MDAPGGGWDDTCCYASWFQIDLLQDRTVVGVKTQGEITSSSGEWTASYYLYT